MTARDSFQAFTAKYKHLLNKRFAVLETLAWASKSGRGSFVAFGSVHRAFRASDGPEVFPIPGGMRTDAFDRNVGGIIRPVQSLRILEAELSLGVRARSAYQVEPIATLVPMKILLEVTTDLLRPLLNGEKDVMSFNIQVGGAKQPTDVPVTVKAIQMVDERFRTAVKTALAEFSYSVYPQLPVLVASVNGGEKKPVGFLSQLAVGGFLLSKGIVEQVKTPFSIEFEEFRTQVPVVEMSEEMVKELAVTTTVNSLSVYMGRYGAWFEMLFTEAVDDGVEII